MKISTNVRQYRSLKIIMTHRNVLPFETIIEQPSEPERNTKLKSTTLLPMKTKGSLDIRACSPKQSVHCLGSMPLWI